MTSRTGARTGSTSFLAQCGPTAPSSWPSGGSRGGGDAQRMGAWVQCMGASRRPDPIDDVPSVADEWMHGPTDRPAHHRTHISPAGSVASCWLRNQQFSGPARSRAWRDGQAVLLGLRWDGVEMRSWDPLGRLALSGASPLQPQPQTTSESRACLPIMSYCLHTTPQTPRPRRPNTPTAPTP